MVRDTYNFNRKDPIATDFELKEKLLEPVVLESKKSQEHEMMEAKDLDIPQPLLSTTVSSNDADTKLSSAGAENREDQLISEFKASHNQDNISKEDLNSIVEVIREGNKGTNLGEEKFLNSQYANDLYLIQIFIEEKFQEQKQKNFANNGINVHNKSDFPTLVLEYKLGFH